MSDDTIKVQRLRQARVTVFNREPDTVVLILEGGVDEQCFWLSRAEFAVLADRFSQDAALLNAKASALQ